MRRSPGGQVGYARTWSSEDRRQAKMFDMSLGIAEIIFRTAIVYIVLFILIRFIGKKHVGELAPFDLVVLLILSETVQNAMVGDDKSLLAGLIAAATLILLAQGVSYVTWKSKRLARAIEGVPKILVRHGHCYRKVMEQEQISISELLEAMRLEGCSNIADIRVAILENDGKITVIKRGGP
jgi:uncharacterized membrane protein YcaP (DUF421 family)